MYHKPYDRKFGIEFEFEMPSLREEFGRQKYSAFEKILREAGLNGWSVSSDGSEYEVRTPPLSGPNGFKSVKKFLELVKNRGARTTHYDGLHVHHDGPEFINNDALVVHLVENWLTNQEEIMKMAHGRRKNSGACPVWNQEALNNLKNVGFWSQRNHFVRRNLNIGSLIRKGTIEIRLHEGTLEYEHILSWVRFGQSFIAKAIDDFLTFSEPLGAVSSPNDLLQKINVSRNASRFMTRKMENVYGQVMA
jgi:putative amidoligase enzyme